MDPAILIPLVGMATGVLVMGILVSPVILWLRHKQQLAKEKLRLEQSDPEAEALMKRVLQRVENLEELVCRLDIEINSQLERSIGLGKIATSDAPEEGNHSPATNVASAMEKRYQILKELGRGGMGIVFQAHDKQLQEQVAIKILSPLYSNDPVALERLKREVSAARRVTHTNVIRTYDISEMNGLHYVSMEYFAGDSLKEYVKQGRNLLPMEAYNIAVQICDGLQAAHERGVVHRDLKSQNVIINSKHEVKIIDFGLASVKQTQGMSATGLIMGTPEYMAPEQVTGGRVDARSDIYSLGIILYELYTGNVPFTGNSPISVGFQQVHDEPVRPRQVNPQIPESVEQVILKALQKDPQKRFGTVAELRRHLNESMDVSSSIKDADLSKREERGPRSKLHS